MLTSLFNPDDTGLLSVVLISLAIVAARIVDVSLSTFRTVAVIQGRRGLAWILGFFEVLVWVLVVSEVLVSVSEHTWFAVPYAIGFATGNWVGIVIEEHVALGRQNLRIFTREGPTMAPRLRDAGFGVTEFDGRGKDGPVTMLFVEAERKSMRHVARLAREIDPKCYYSVGDVRRASTATTQAKRQGS